jgi:hypothetical protein
LKTYLIVPESTLSFTPLFQEISFRQNLFDWPTVFQTFVCKFISDLKNIAPFFQCLLLTTYFNFNCSRFISRLFCIGSPTNITWLISSVVINPIKRMLWRWPISNFTIKFIKIILPFITHRDSATSIGFKHGIFWIITTTFSRFPSPMFRCASHVVFCVSHKSLRTMGREI